MSTWVMYKPDIDRYWRPSSGWVTREFAHEYTDEQRELASSLQVPFKLKNQTFFLAVFTFKYGGVFQSWCFQGLKAEAFKDLNHLF